MYIFSWCGLSSNDIKYDSILVQNGCKKMYTFSASIYANGLDSCGIFPKNYLFTCVASNTILLQRVNIFFHLFHQGNCHLFILRTDIELRQTGWEHTSQYIPGISGGSSRVHRNFNHHVHCIRAGSLCVHCAGSDRRALVGISASCGWLV